MHDAGIALEDLRPVLWKTTKVVTIDVPDALDGVHNSLPSLIETAKSVDETLTWLSNFKLTIPNPFGTDWEYDLGISYDPEMPLDQALEGMGQNLEDIPDNMRDLNESLATTDANLIIVSDDLAYLAGDLDTMNRQVQEIIPQIETLAGNIESGMETFQQTRTNIPEAFDLIRKILKIFLGLLIFTQIPSLYMGWLLISGKLFPTSYL